MESEEQRREIADFSRVLLNLGERRYSTALRRPSAFILRLSQMSKATRNNGVRVPTLVGFFATVKTRQVGTLTPPSRHPTSYHSPEWDIHTKSLKRCRDLPVQGISPH